MTLIRPMEERDLPEARQIVRVAFGTFLGAPDPENFWPDRDYVYGRFGAEHTAAFVAEDGGRLLGSNFATRWGSFGFFGPLTVRPDLWDSGVGQQLVAAVCEQFAAWGTRHAGLFTFPHSAKHIGLYGKFGFYPRFLTAIMAAPAREGGLGGGASRYSARDQGGRAEAETALGDLCGRLYDGLDLAAEVRTIEARALGDTLLVRDDSGLAGFAACHWGPASEAGDGFCYVKFGAVRPGEGAAERFTALLDGCAGLAHDAGAANLLVGVNLAHEAAYRQMRARGFRTLIQGVAMHRPNEPGYSRPELFVLNDWR